jgi:hypothetical protein
MIQISTYCALLLHQGGCRMYPLSSSNQEQDVLTHIWSHLSSDLQTRVIGLLAEIALNAVGARSQNQPQRKEARHVEQSANPQNPS